MILKSGYRFSEKILLRDPKAAQHELGVVIGPPLEFQKTLRWRKSRFARFFDHN
jgi:hypothetical protein